MLGHDELEFANGCSVTNTERPRLPLIEICVEGIDGLLAAQAAGADRVELCASLVEGGITPSFGTVRAALELATIPFHVIVRPRGGDFLYSDAEYRSMLTDVRALSELGVAGVVVGCLNADGTVDEKRMSELEGVALLAGLVQQAGKRIVILGCGGLNPRNIAEVRERTGLTEMHFAALKDVPSAMRYRNPQVGMGGTDLDREYRNTVTDAALVAATIAAARA
ncbi:MAG: copper homeostasis protein CutC [Mesorhizobium sp.]|nr:MAG: copper homeostasis protein CutC [Mesorhizobium sp.]